jgi:hypothetical protein
MSKIVTGRIVNNDGEIKGEIYEGDRITRGASIEYLSRTETWKLENFFKGHIAEIELLMKDLNVYEKAFLFSMAIYVGYDDCCLKHRNGKELDFDGIVEITGISRGKLSQVINSLRKKDIIYKGINSSGIQYFVNPWIYCKGSRINKVLRTMFRNYRVRVLGKKRWGEV